jgi:hypothetical protein
LLLLQFSAVGDNSLQFSAIAGDRFRKEIPTQIDAHSQDMIIDRKPYDKIFSPLNFFLHVGCPFYIRK